MRRVARHRTDRLEHGSEVTTYMAHLARDGDWWWGHLHSTAFPMPGSLAKAGLMAGECSSLRVAARMDAVQAQIHVAAEAV